MKKLFELSQDMVQFLAKKFGTPLMVLSEDVIEYNYSFLLKKIPQVRVFYAVKSNPQKNIIEKLIDLGSSFDVASDGEIQMLVDMGVKAENMVYANPVKTIKGLELARKYGLKMFTFDSAGEIKKIATYIENAEVLLRIKVENSEALVDLNTKFGINREEIMPLLHMARDLGLKVRGLCFHVGSQVTKAGAYVKTINACADLYKKALEEGFEFDILDIGGGFPIPFADKEVDVEKMFSEINEVLQKKFGDIKIWCEPGRYICGTACHLLTSIIGQKERDDRVMYFLDEGMYGTFSAHVLDFWEFAFETFKKGNDVLATFAGPSCDSTDIVFKDRKVPYLEEGDVLLIKNCGAYTSATASNFNGFAVAPLVVWERVKPNAR